MKFIALPSGIIINLNQVAYVDSPGIPAGLQASDAVLNVHFSAVSYAVGKMGAGGGSLHLSLTGSDIDAFLFEMAQLEIEVGDTKAAIKKQRD